ncbi:MAG: NUDIX domain-containing protein [archaeon]
MHFLKYYILNKMVIVVNALILNEKNEVLIVTRSDGKGKGLLSLPGGKVEKNEAIEEALMREVNEETNLEITDYAYFGNVKYNNDFPIIELFICHAKGDIKLDNIELSSCQYLEAGKMPLEKFYTPDTKIVSDLFKRISNYVKSVDLLKKIVEKNYILLTDRGNSSIILSLRLAKRKGVKDIYIADQGGWLTYKHFPKRLNLTLNEIKSQYGIISLDSVKNIKEGSALLLNSFPAYYTEQEDMKKIHEICRKRNILLINDITGSIGLKSSKPGDVILGSFGEHKPVNCGYGGFIATDLLDDYNYFAQRFHKGKPDNFLANLASNLSNLGKRRIYLSEISQKVKKELSEFEIINKSGEGIDVIVKFNNQKQKDKLIDYCKKNNYEYSMCPDYIRVLTDAICIEVKRL